MNNTPRHPVTSMSTIVYLNRHPVARLPGLPNPTERAAWRILARTLGGVARFRIVGFGAIVEAKPSPSETQP